MNKNLDSKTDGKWSLPILNLSNKKVQFFETEIRMPFSFVKHKSVMINF